MSDAPKPGDRECRSLGIEGSVAETASSASPALPMVEGLAGWVLVPREPTEAMLRAGYEAQHPKPGSHAYGLSSWATWEEACQIDGWRGAKVNIYRAMLAAAPPAEPRADDGGEAVHSSLPPAEQITQPSHDDEGLIERLVNLLDQAREGLATWRGREMVRAILSEAAESRSLLLEAEVEELRRGLEPFAREAEEWGGSIPDGERVMVRAEMDDECDAARFTVGDLRKARALLSPRLVGVEDEVIPGSSDAKVSATLPCRPEGQHSAGGGEL